MKSYENILLERQDNIAIVSINRSKALNALNSDIFIELAQAFDELRDDTLIRVVILTGAGEKAFGAGGDISQIKDLNPEEGRLFAKLGQAALRKLIMLPQPVIAAVNGFALGGGCELALACDIRIASENAKFGQPEVTLGLTPVLGGTQRLPRLVGAGYASQLFFTGEIIDAKEAFRIGLVNQIYPSEQLKEKALALAATIASRAPVAIQLTKSAIQRGINFDLDNALGYEAEIFGLTLSTGDQKEGCAAFLEKRKPQYQGK